MAYSTRPTALERAEDAKACTRCSQAKPLNESHVRKDRNGEPRWLSSECKPCTSVRSLETSARRAQKPPETTGPPCLVCGVPVGLKAPGTAGRQALYCSQKCRDRNRKRERMPREDQLRYDRARSLRRYGLTEETWAVMLAAQEGCCAICGATEAGGKGGWHVDHCHQTNRVRGLLCHKCNTALGLFQDDPDLLLAAAMYLERHRQLVT